MNPHRAAMRLMRLTALTLLVFAMSMHRAVAADSLANLNTVTVLSSTVPANGDVNPYGSLLSRWG